MGVLVGTYLRARRAMVRPQDVDLPVGLGWRRVAGLRREELADLAGVSREYYTRLEQGQPIQPSLQVLRSLADALRLDGDATRHLLRLARIDAGEEELAPTRPAAVASMAPDLIASVSSTPAVVVDRNQDIVLANTLAGRIGYGRLVPSRNLVEVAFDAVYRRATPRWASAAAWAVAALRFYGDPRDTRFAEVVSGAQARHGQLFETMWERHEAHAFSATAVDLPLDGRTVQMRVQGLEISASGLHLLMCHSVGSTDRGLPGRRRSVRSDRTHGRLGLVA
ncbi:helix-turn-helix domain-containing protein [Cellulosimicrobium cellulans]|uniref:helix-turn-helix domain-containing protein n=1 Tax=Cellulosimicrobium cellulans TaxID=1710 RepID=UPI003814491D